MRKKEDKANEYAEWLHNEIEEYYGQRCEAKDMYYGNCDIRAAYEAGWDCALKSQWISVGERLPHEGEIVLVFTSNGKVSISKRYQPKDCYGNNIVMIAWKGSTTFVNSIVAWMPIPPFDEILKQIK